MSHGDIAWMLISCGLAMLMAPGLVFFYSELVLKRNALNTINMSFICLALIPLVWSIPGYSLVFSDNNPWTWGLNHVGLSNLNVAQSSTATIPPPDHKDQSYNIPFAVIGAFAAAVIGLVTTTPASGFVTPMGAIVIGGLAALITQVVLLY